jgi:hypothetical protein
MEFISLLSILELNNFDISVVKHPKAVTCLWVFVINMPESMLSPLSLLGGREIRNELGWSQSKGGGIPTERRLKK